MASGLGAARRLRRRPGSDPPRDRRLLADRRRRDRAGAPREQRRDRADRAARRSVRATRSQEGRRHRGDATRRAPRAGRRHARRHPAAGRVRGSQPRPGHAGAHRSSTAMRDADRLVGRRHQRRRLWAPSAPRSACWPPRAGSGRRCRSWPAASPSPDERSALDIGADGWASDPRDLAALIERLGTRPAAWRRCRDGGTSTLDPRPRLTLDGRELAARAGTTPEHVADLVARGVLTPAGPDRFVIGDIHRMRVIEAFEHAGVPLDALVEASRAGRVSFDYYDELHPEPSLPSDRSYDGLPGVPRAAPARALDAVRRVRAGRARSDAHLGVDEEPFIADLIAMLEATGRPGDGGPDRPAVRRGEPACRRGVHRRLRGGRGGVRRRVPGLPPERGLHGRRGRGRGSPGHASTLAGWLAAAAHESRRGRLSAEETERDPGGARVHPGAPGRSCRGSRSST